MCVMCGCGMGGNNGNIESPNSPMMVVPNIFGGDIDSLSSSGIEVGIPNLHITQAEK